MREYYCVPTDVCAPCWHLHEPCHSVSCPCVQSASENRHFFRPPRDAERLALWQRAVPTLEKKFSSLCSVSDLHFRDKDILKVFKHNICGEVVAILRDKWALKDDAVLRLFPNCPSYLSKTTGTRKAPARKLSLAKSKRQKGQSEHSISAVMATLKQKTV